MASANAELRSSRLRPLASRSLAEEAADRVRELILAGEFRQGERLVESRIAEQLNISRGPIREAFKLLRAEGLVEERPRRGTFVIRLGVDDVREIYGVRAAVEIWAASKLAASRDESQLDELRRIVAKIDTAAGMQDWDGVRRNDLAFHEAVCRLSGNERLAEVFRRYVRVPGGLHSDEREDRPLNEIARIHRTLLEAIESGDTALAAARFEEHIAESRESAAAFVAAVDR